MLLCAEHPVAKAIEGAVRLWPLAQHLPVALVDRCTGPLREPATPFARVWAAVWGSRSARFALPLSAPTIVPGEPEVRVRRLPEDMLLQQGRPEVLAGRSSFCDIDTAPAALADLIAMIVAEKDHQPISLVLADVLASPGLHADMRRRLLEGVSARTGFPPTELVGEGISPWTGGPYALNAVGGVTYIARDGRYWRRGRREKEFTPVTNFVVRLFNDGIDAKDRATHRACLEVDGRRVDFSFSSAVFDSPRRLLTALTHAATLAGTEYPIISESKAKRLLPEIVKATQQRPNLLRVERR